MGVPCPGGKASLLTRQSCRGASRHGRSGFTFAEVAVGVGLAAMIATVIISVTVFSQRRGRTSIEKADYQRMGLITVNHLMHHLLGAKELVVPVMGKTPACCFQGYDFKYHVYAYDAKRRLLAHRIFDPSKSMLQKEKILATGVAEVDFSVNEDLRLLKLRLVFRKAGAQKRMDDEYVLKTALALRN